ncbi:hypothetical protein PENANT_c256G11271, partial [Penicillium antarcticum]
MSLLIAPELEIRRERYHRIPAYLSISDPAQRMTGSSSGLDPTPREVASMGSGRGPTNTASTNPRNKSVSSKKTSSSKPAAKQTASKPVSKLVSKPASVATGGNATIVATRSIASQPSEVSIMRTPDNQQNREAEGFQMDTDMEVDFQPSQQINQTNQTGVYQSKRAPPSLRAPRSEP